jgi:uncharacterized protein (TIGR02231 family)
MVLLLTQFSVDFNYLAIMKMIFQKNFFALLALGLLNQNNILAQTVESEVWPVTNVTIHESGAHVSHAGLANFSGSNTEIEVLGVANDILSSTIQINLQPGVTLQSMRYEVRDRKGIRFTKLVSITDSITLLEYNKRVLEVQIEALLEEKQFLIANREIGSQQEVLLVDDVIEMADFLRERNLDLGLEILEAQVVVQIIHEELIKLVLQKNELLSLGADKEGVIHLKLNNSPSSPKTSLITLSYLTQSASWWPEYEVNYDAASVTFHRNAFILQYSGVDWTGADIMLVSGKPSGSLSPAEFTDWVVSTIDKSNISMRGSRSDGASVIIDGVQVMEVFESDEEFQDDTFAGSARFHFAVQPNTTVKSDGKPIRVKINEFNLSGDVRYYAAPAVSSEAYITVRCPDWIGNDLITGWAQVVSGNSYLGGFNMEVPTVGDTLILPLGANPHVLCSRELKAEDSKSSVFAGKKTVVQTWELTVENDSDDHISVDLVENLPRTSNRDSVIELTVVASEGGIVDNINHEVVFALELEPFEKRVVTVVITAKYPSSARINNF